MSEAARLKDRYLGTVEKRAPAPNMPEAFKERIEDAIFMYRDGAKQPEVVRKHGSIVAREALQELNKRDPRWWAR
jgi:hypothetical protein